MMNTMEMMQSLSVGDMPMDKAMMQACVMSMNACSMAATMCASHDMGMKDDEGCGTMCMNMADMADACMRVMMRPMGMSMESMEAMMTACVMMAKECSAECKMHAETDEMCRYCSMACDDMVASCEAMMAAMA